MVNTLLTVIFVLFLAGCKTTAVNTSYVSNYANYDRYGQPIEDLNQLSVPRKNAWDVTRSKLQLTKEFKHPRVSKEVKSYNSYPLHMTKVSSQAAPFYHYVLQEVLKRSFPSEVALLPVIESMYNPNAYSQGKAAGVWQFIPSTAKYLGIDKNDWYDGRRDIIVSTKTALDYLERYNKRFDGDWLLTFAAYNAGGGTVSKAMRKNRERGLATDYWSLKLPKETTHYVPRILAIAAIVKDPKKYNINIPSIDNTPYFKVIDVKSQIDLAKVAKLSRIKLKKIQLLNSGFNRNITSPTGPHRLLIPVKKAAQLKLALSKINRYEGLNWTKYKVQSRDSLGSIALRHGVSISAIKQTNALANSIIRVGKTLLIPKSINTNASPGHLASLANESNAHRVYKINNGDTVWEIAKKHKKSVKEILAFNGLSKNSTLRVGGSIKIPQG